MARFDRDPELATTGEMTEREVIRPLLLTLQVVLAALAIGVAIFGAIVGFNAAQANWTPPPPVPGAPMSPAESIWFFTILAGGMLASGLLIGFVIRHTTIRVLAGAIARDPVLSLRARFDKYFIVLILAASLLEGPSLFAVIITLIVRHPAGLLIAATGVALMLAVWFPTESRFGGFVAAAEERAMRIGATLP